ncbi:FAD:protein FMN transferase [Bacteroides sp.]|uniref:FAD:protein FMN transferase n=1 Tax=Bacteroides sp. TaxID=29523 RepID=UPI00262B27D3|nr:FAD:protein FMN transferase [Bacteroides sp.]MDD3038346.1 FAD:protein FMN transferase [Bacteroides sp.]
MFHGFINHIMGTRFDILLIHTDPTLADKLWSAIVNELECLEKMLNRFNPQSEVALLNKHLSANKTQISPELWSMLQLCRQYYEQTLHLFDITLKDFSQVNFHSDCFISSNHPDLSFDFGGFAKGYALKKIRKMIVCANVKDAFVDFGNSSIIGIGHHPYGDCWKVSFLNPYSQTLLREFDLLNMALSTSGNTRQYTGHIINPLTGIYDEQRKASTIVSEDPLDAEVLSTVWMIANEQQREQISTNFNNIKGTIYTL